MSDTQLNNKMKEHLKIMNMAVHMLGYCEQDDSNMSIETTECINNVITAWRDMLLDLSKDNATESRISAIESQIDTISQRVGQIEIDAELDAYDKITADYDLDIEYE